MEFRLEWLWQGLALWVITLLLATLGSFMMAYLKATGSRLVSPILYGLATFALTLFIILVLRGMAALPRPQQEITPENVESNIRNWLDTFRLAAKKESNPEAYFIFVVTAPNGNPIVVTRTKALDRYITYQATLTVSPQHLEILDKLPEDQSTQLIRELTIELARSRIGFSIVGPGLKGIVLNKALPITNNLTEGTFAQYLDEMDSGLILARETIVLALERSRQGKK